MSKTNVLIPLALLLATSPAMAEGFYGGAGLGLVNIEEEDLGESFKDSPFGWRIFGGYDFNENFALEGAYVSSGTAEDTVFGEDVEVEFSGFTVSAVGLLPLSDTMDLIAKAGFYTGEQEVTVQGFTLDEDDDGFTVGAGMRFRTSDQFVVRGELDWFDTDLDSLWSVSVGFQYYFGN